MIRKCDEGDLRVIYAIINAAAAAYKSIIPQDRWHEPYMPEAELLAEVKAGVVFWGYEEEGGELLGVMGIQPVQDVCLIRHAYVRPDRQKQGIGKQLLVTLCRESTRPVLVGTWAAAVWAIRFYEQNGFQLVSPAEKDRLLGQYWSIPQRQIETSVVLADKQWIYGRRSTR